ncbi:MAG: ABC transporter substrate-binding protein [Proteobacteria bacterium]|nr:ABC transporter substrate-binding protein [Pseudomonadota bacterium]
MRKIWVLMIVMALVLMVGRPAQALTEYNVTGSVDFTGPYAVVMPPIDEAGKAFFAWWNDEVGPKLGVKLNRKTYDTRYDPALTASLWPGILSGDKPLAHFGLGGPDVAALMKRLPQDKVPLIMSTGTYGFIWLPDTWVIQCRPTYVHESAGFFNWAHMNLIKDRPIRVAAISSKVSPAYVDGVRGFEEFAKATDWIELVGTEWVQMKPVSLLSEVQRLSKDKPDFFWNMNNTYQGVGIIKANKELGQSIPVVLSSHNGIAMSALATKDLKILEGNYDSCAYDPGIDLENPAAKIYMKYKEKLGLKYPWSLMSVQVAAMHLQAFRAIERAIKAVGPDKLTGEAVFNAFFSGPFTSEELLGLMPTQTFTHNAPFSEKDIKVKCTTVKDGKHVSVSPDWIPVPPVPKWVK